MNYVWNSEKSKLDYSIAELNAQKDYAIEELRVKRDHAIASLNQVGFK